jgi:hypothetical protein
MSELVQVDVEVPEDVDDGGVQGKTKPRVQQVAEDDDFVVSRSWYSFPARGSAGPNHAVLHQGVHVGLVDLTPAECVRLRDLPSDSIASPLRCHICDLSVKQKQKRRGTKEILRQGLRSSHASWMQVAAAVWGNPRAGLLFITHQRR